MDRTEVRGKVKEIVSEVANIDVDKINDDASFSEDLDLDSLSLLEIGVDLDYAYKLGVPEEDLAQLKTVEDAVELVLSRIAAEQ